MEVGVETVDNLKDNYSVPKNAAIGQQPTQQIKCCLIKCCIYKLKNLSVFLTYDT